MFILMSKIIYIRLFNCNNSCVLYAMANRQLETVQWMIENNLVRKEISNDENFIDITNNFQVIRQMLVKNVILAVLTPI